MPFALFPEIHLFIHLFIYLFIYLKTIDIVENVEWRIWQGAAGAGGHVLCVIMTQANENRYVIHP